MPTPAPMVRPQNASATERPKVKASAVASVLGALLFGAVCITATASFAWWMVFSTPAAWQDTVPTDAPVIKESARQLRAHRWVLDAIGYPTDVRDAGTRYGDGHSHIDVHLILEGEKGSALANLTWEEGAERWGLTQATVSLPGGITKKFPLLQDELLPAKLADESMSWPPEDPRARALHAAQSGEMLAAIHLLSTAMDEPLDNAVRSSMLHWRGRLYAAMGNDRAAMADYKQALSLDPTHSASRSQLDRLGSPDRVEVAEQPRATPDKPAPDRLIPR